MTLLPCPACGKRISRNAESCPSCGEPLKEGWQKEAQAGANAKWIVKTVFWSICIFVAATFLWPDASPINRNSQTKMANLPSAYPSWSAERKINWRTGEARRSDYGHVMIFDQDNWGDYWNFTAGRIKLSCRNERPDGVKRPMVLIKPSGRGWLGLNGAAIGVGGYSDGRRFIAEGEDGLRLAGLSDNLLAIGLELCR